jgi:hypothetical protein
MNRGMLRPVLALLAPWLLASCGSEMPVAGSRRPELRQTPRLSLFRPPLIPPAPSQPVTVDDEYAQLNARIPGFAGLWYDDGQLTVGLVPEHSEELARQELETFFRDRKIGARGDVWTRVALGADIRFRPAIYEFATLKRWYDQTVTGVLSLQGVVSTDIKGSRNSLQFGVVDSSHIPAVRDLLLGAGVPADAFVIRVTAPVIDLQIRSLRDSVRPVPGGVQIRYSQYLSGSYCSLGVTVRVVYDGFVHPYFLTASHCSALRGETDWIPYYQDEWDGGTNYEDYQTANYIGYEVWDQSYVQGGACPSGRYCQWMDATLAMYEAPSGNDDYGKLAKPVDYRGPDDEDSRDDVLDYEGTWDVVDIYHSAAPDGMTLYAHGMGRGAAVGEVEADCVNYSVTGTFITYWCMGRVHARNGFGDSGGPVYSLNTYGSVYLHGLIQGGTSGGDMHYSYIWAIKQQYGDVRACGGC